MLKRMMALILLIALALTTAGAGLAPAKAAPTAAVTNAPNASLLPADTAFYVDFHTTDLNKITQFATDTIKKVAGITISNPYKQFDDALTKAFKRTASFEKDIQPWLGDHASLAVLVSDAQLSALQSDTTTPSRMGAFSNPNALVILAVKDDAAAASFVRDLMAAVPQGTATESTDTINGAPATIFSQPTSANCGSRCYEIIEAKGFLVIGSAEAANEMLTTLKGSQPTLADDANFGKLMGTLKGDSIVSMYVSPRFYQAQLATMQDMMSGVNAVSPMPSVSSSSDGSATPDAIEAATPAVADAPSAATPAANASLEMLKSVYNILQGQAFSLRMDGNLLAFDISTGIDSKALASFYQQNNLSSSLLNISMTPVEGKLADQIPAKALAVAMFNNLPQLYDALKSSLGMFSQMMAQLPASNMKSLNQIARGLGQFETMLKAGFNIDLQQDVFSWMGGEFALYMIYNPNSVLATMGRQQWPFDHTLLIHVSDAAKATSFLNKLNVGLAKLNVTPESAGDNLYKVTGTGKQQISLAYGLVGNTFLITTGSGLDTATAAIKGDGVLSSTDAWKRAQANSIKPTGQYWYLNFTQVAPVVKAVIATLSNSSATPREAMQIKILTNTLDLFESATISGGILQPDGISSASVQINLK